MGQLIPYSEVQRRRVQRIIESVSAEMRLINPKLHPWTDPRPHLPTFVRRGLGDCWECGKRKEEHEQ